MKVSVFIVVTLVMICVMLLALHMNRTAGDSSFEFDISEMEEVEPGKVLFTEVAAYPVPMRKPVAIGVRSDDAILVGGDREIVVLDSAGDVVSSIEVGAEPRCIASGGGRIYAGTDRGITVLTEEGEVVADLDLPHRDSWLTSVIMLDDGVFFADFGVKTIWRYSAEGILLTNLACKADGEATGLIVPSPYFDVARGVDDSIWVANTGRHRLENYRENGEFLGAWGKSSPALAGFAGCCNPSHFTVRSDGSFVTCEKGFVRVKVYDPSGKFVGLVAGPDSFKRNAVGLDVAVDAKDRILVLDPASRCVRIFTEH